MNEHPRDILHTLDAEQDIGTYEPLRFVMRLQFRRDGSVTWTPIPLSELPSHKVTYDTKSDSVVRGEARRRDL